MMKMVPLHLGATKEASRLLQTRSLMVVETIIIITIPPGVVIEDVAVMEVAVAIKITTTTVVMMVTDTTMAEEAIKAKLGRVVITITMTSTMKIIVLEQATTTSEERSTRSDLIDSLSSVLLKLDPATL